MTTLEIVLLSILCSILFPAIIIGYVIDCFKNKQITYTVYFNSLKPVYSFITDVKKIKFKKGIVYIKSYDIEEKHYQITIIKKENFIEAIKTYDR